MGPTACLDANPALPVPHDFVTHCTLGGPETKKRAAAQKVAAAHPTFNARSPNLQLPTCSTDGSAIFRSVLKNAKRFSKSRMRKTVFL